VSRNAPHTVRQAELLLKQAATDCFSAFLISLWILSPTFICQGQNLSAVQPPPGKTARVVEVESSSATSAFRPDPEIVLEMMRAGITNITGKTNIPDAWASLVNKKDVIGIKVYAAPGPNSGTRPAVVAALLDTLHQARIPAKNIIIWDRHMTDLRLAGFTDLAKKRGVGVTSTDQANYDPEVFYEVPLLGNLVWGDLDFGKQGQGVGRKSYLSTIITKKLTKIINVTPMLNHNLSGVSGNLYSLTMGSIDNLVRFESDATRLSEAVPDIFNLPQIRDKVVLNIVDALICQYEGGERGLLHYSKALNQLRFSRDPVALDVLSVREIDKLRRESEAPEIKPNLDVYSNSSLLDLGVSEPKDILVSRLSLP
jgi:hypothetical protein